MTNFILIVNLIPIVNKVAIKTNPNNYSNMFVLGDSLSDTGAFVQYQGHFEEKVVKSGIHDCNLNIGPMPANRLGTRPCLKLIKEWKPKLFSAPFYQNSFSNGPVAVQVLADLLGISNFKSASYDAQNFNNVGYNYATGGAKVLNSNELTPFEFTANIQARTIGAERFGLKEQVNMLKQQHANINAKDLILVNIGNNDISEITSIILLLENAEWKKFFMNRLDRIVDNLFMQVKELIDYGFNHIILFNNVDFSKTPRYINDLQTSKTIQEAVNKYNKIFALKYETLNQNLDFRKKVKNFDFNFVFEETLNEFKLNNKITTKAAVDINWVSCFLFGDTFTPYYIDDASDDNVDNYAFFDGVHPTGPFHYRIAEKLHHFVNGNWT